jgi:uncharacterized surface protein with fasciclin (FAS1) repeats
VRFGGGISALLFGAAIVVMQPAATALTPSEVSSIAQQITVRIDGANTGSGVIIERQGNIYTVVTCWHVVQIQGKYTVYAPNGKQYTINNSQARKLPGVDLAVFQFTSNDNYRVAEKGNSEQVRLGKTVHIAGYPQGTPDIDFRSGSISRLVTNPKEGYAFVYDIGGFPGMSGGAILDEDGKLVGIHGLANTHPDTYATTVYGIPLKTYLSLTPNKTSTISSNRENRTISTPVTTTTPRVNTNKLSITATLAKNGSFGTLSKYLEISGLAKELNSQGSFTIFAPTDAAFAKIPQGALRDLLKPENVEVLLKILRYHIVANKVLSRNLKSGNLKSTIEQYIDVRITPEKLMVNDGTLIQTDIEASNGVIHAIDNVILPPDL